MTVTPSELFDLALSRHRQPWGWTVHLAGLAGLGLAMLLHSGLTLAAAIILLGSGFFHWPDPPNQDTRWFRFVHQAVEWEKDWVAYPWTWRKWMWFLFSLGCTLYICWALWVREAASLALLAGFVVLARVIHENRENGIDP